MIALSLAIGLLPEGKAAACEARNFLTMSLPVASERPALSEALELAYPGVTVDDVAGTLTIGTTTLPLGADEERSVLARINDGTIKDQFAIVYPLDFDLTIRETPWFDPGRVRNDPMFRALYGESERAVASSLVRTTYRGAALNTTFAVTREYCAAQQLQAALNGIAADGRAMDQYFANVGGSFNWRVIAGTRRLSAHSFGIAVDFNTDLGGYWRWAGAVEGDAGEYNNRYPESLVRHMERFGFIWGGKWHHFDGMHFEYRPELILYARLVQEAGLR
jgi:hypothetical protein